MESISVFSWSSHNSWVLNHISLSIWVLLRPILKEFQLNCSSNLFFFQTGHRASSIVTQISSYRLYSLYFSSVPWLLNIGLSIMVLPKTMEVLPKTNYPFPKMQRHSSAQETQIHSCRCFSSLHESNPEPCDCDKSMPVGMKLLAFTAFYPSMHFPLVTGFFTFLCSANLFIHIIKLYIHINACDQFILSIPSIFTASFGPNNFCFCKYIAL